MNQQVKLRKIAGVLLTVLFILYFLTLMAGFVVVGLIWGFSRAYNPLMASFPRLFFVLSEVGLIYTFLMWLLSFSKKRVVWWVIMILLLVSTIFFGLTTSFSFTVRT